MRTRLLSSSLFFLLLGTANAQTAADTNPAQQADVHWLQMVDAGDYQGAWNSAAQLMQTAAPEPAFQKSIGDVRTPLGAPGSRTLVHAEARSSLPGAPDGHYIVAQYATTFAHKAQATETVIALQEQDGSWHVVGYFIR